MKIVGKQYKDAYNTQEERGTFDVPPSGTYHAVNYALQRQTIGKNNTPKMQVWTKILAAISTENPAEMDEAKKWVGETVQQPLWWNLTPEKPTNIERVACMSTANGFNPDDAFDTDNDKDCVNALTGTPYQLKVRRKEEEWEGKLRKVMDVAATQLLSKEARKAYTSAPDWKKTVGEPESRMKPRKDAAPKGNGGSKAKNNDSGGGGGGTSVSDVDPFSDMPFSEG